MYKRFVQDSLSISRLYWTVRKIDSAPSRHPCAHPTALTRLLRRSPARRDGNAPTDPICDESDVLNSS